MNTKDAIALTNSVHKHANLDVDKAMLLWEEGPESHPVRQTLLGALKRPNPKKIKHANTKRRKAK